MPRSFADIKRQVRSELHKQLAVTAVLIRNGVTIGEVKARLHQSPFMQGDIDYQGYTEMEEGYLRVVVEQSLNLQRGDVLHFQDYGKQVAMAQRRPRLDVTHETWVVKEV